MTNPMESFDIFSRHCIRRGIKNPFTRLQWHVTIKYLKEETAYSIACDVLAGSRFGEAVADLSGANLNHTKVKGTKQ